MSMKIPELYEQIEKIIDTNQIQYEISKRNPEYTILIKKAFFLSLDSTLRILTSKIEIYDIPDMDFLDLIRTNKEVLLSALQLEADLQLKSKEAFSLKEILKIIDAFDINNVLKPENVKIIIQYFNEETICSQQNARKKICDNFKVFYKNLEKILGNLRHKRNFDFNKFLASILFDEFNKIGFLEFMQLILEKILEKNELIKNSSQMIKMIIESEDISCSVESIEKNIGNIRDGQSLMFKRLNEVQNAFLDEIIMDIFERKIIKYFELIPTLKDKKLEKYFKTYFTQNKKGANKTGIIFDKSFKIFEKALKILDSISDVNYEKKENQNTNLLKLYCIVYVKIYFNYLTNFIVNNFQEMGSIKIIMDCIKNIQNKNFSKVIKIYILKLIYNLKSCNFSEFTNFEFEQKGIYFFKEIEGAKKSEDMLTYFFLPSEQGDFKKYEEILDAFIKNINFNVDNKNLETLLEKYGLDLFLELILNKIISNLPLPQFESKDLYKNFSAYTKNIINEKYKKNKELLELLSIFFDCENYNQNTKPKLISKEGKIDVQTYEALLYGFRFCINSLLDEKGEKINDNKLLYPILLSKNITKVIKETLIPGIDYQDETHLRYLDAIKYHMDELQDDEGCYVCSCGFYYYIPKCGFPTRNGSSFNCYECGQKCGWAPKVVKAGLADNHGMVVRKGHYRIFKNIAVKKYQMSRWQDSDKNIPNILYDEYLKNVIEPIRKKVAFGFNEIDKGYFENQDKNIRKLSNIGYRLLNFISYCHLFYSYCLGNINQEELNKCLIKDCDILEIIRIDWNLLKESLQQKDVASIQIFLNMIFKDLTKLLKKS